MFVTFKTYSDKPVEIVINTEHVVYAKQASPNSVGLFLTTSPTGIEVQGILADAKRILNDGNPPTVKSIPPEPPYTPHVTAGTD